VPQDSRDLRVLDDKECRALLNQAQVGRVVVSIGALPAALPVNYRLLCDAIVFFTGEGMKLHAAVNNAVIGFEVDRIDEATQTGWSVLAVGVANEVTDPTLITQAQLAGLRPWATGDRSRLVCLPVTTLSGREIA
jgi:nitroimidazol reductase NimA-like FMN-containing flavoprotein (pyridoxamine 5'-phosphate oxidase superfamily)